MTKTLKETLEDLLERNPTDARLKRGTIWYEENAELAERPDYNAWARSYLSDPHFRR